MGNLNAINIILDRFEKHINQLFNLNILNGNFQEKYWRLLLRRMFMAMMNRIAWIMINRTSRIKRMS
jgi:hypothetical protein